MIRRNKMWQLHISRLAGAVQTTGYREHCDFVQSQTAIQGPSIIDFKGTRVAGAGLVNSAYVPLCPSYLLIPNAFTRYPLSLRSTWPQQNFLLRVQHRKYHRGKLYRNRRIPQDLRAVLHHRHASCFAPQIHLIYCV